MSWETRAQAALDSSSSFEQFRDQMEESDPTLPGLTVAEVREWSEEQWNANWEAGCRVLEQSRQTPPTPPEKAEPAANGSDSLSWDTLRSLPESEHIRRKAEIDRFLASEGRT